MNYLTVSYKVFQTHKSLVKLFALQQLETHFHLTKASILSRWHGKGEEDLMNVEDEEEEGEGAENVEKNTSGSGSWHPSLSAASVQSHFLGNSLFHCCVVCQESSGIFFIQNVPIVL